MKIKRQTINEALRFLIVGVIATSIHYVIYWILMHWMSINVAYTIGYILSFICNFLLSSIFTFRSKATVSRGLGFCGAHLTNYLLHILFLNLFCYLGISAEIAPLFVYMIVVPVNFILVRLVFKKIK